MVLRTAHNARSFRFTLLAAVGLGLALLVLASSELTMGTPNVAWAASSSQLSKKLSNLRSELEEIRANLEKAENARKAAQGDVAALDKSIEAAQKALDAAEAAHGDAAEKLAALQDELNQVTVSLAQKQYELAETEFDLEGQQSVYNRRVVDVYKSGGNVAYLAVVLESASFGEMVGRVGMLADVVGQDKTILEQIAALKVRVEAQRLELQEERARVAELERDQAAVTDALKAAADERQAAVDELEAARAAKAKVLAAAEKQVAAWSEQEDEMLAESDRVAELLREAKAAEAARVTKTGSGALAWPVVGAVTSKFGYRIHPIFNVRKMHTGIDIDADMGDPIRAAAAGKVVSAGWRGGYGKCIVISHGGGLATLYGHASELLVSAGEEVERGEVIGKVGSTGYSTGPHLHFEVRVNGSPVDPLGYL